MSDTQAASDDQTRRHHEARHEYNNLAAIVSLTRSPAVLRQVRRLWDDFRQRYPDYDEDPNGIAEILNQTRDG